MWPNYPVTKQVERAFKLKQRIKNLPSCAHVLHKTLNLVISPQDDGEGLIENRDSVKRTFARSEVQLETGDEF